MPRPYVTAREHRDPDSLWHLQTDENVNLGSASIPFVGFCGVGMLSCSTTSFGCLCSQIQL
jgi:hypothetical protein